MKLKLTSWRKIALCVSSLMVTTVASAQMDLRVSGGTYDGVTYSFDYDTNEATVVAGTYTGEVNIPATVNVEGTELKVTTVASNALLNNSTVTKLSLPSTLKTIGASAFRGMTSLTEVEFTGNVGTIGDYTFQGCTNLTSVTFAEGSTIGKLGRYAFASCSGLTSLTLPEVGTMGSFTFQSMTNLERVTFAGHVGKIGVSAFDKDSNLSSVTFADGVTIDSLGITPFAGCTNLTSLTIPEVNVVDLNAFNGLSTLQSVSFTGNVGKIGRNSFLNCTGLSSVSFADGSTIGNIENYAFAGCTGLTSLTLPEVGTISSFTFQSMTNLERISFTGNVGKIGASAFDKDSKLSSVTFADGVTIDSIGTTAFTGCTNLTSLSLPEVNVLDVNAFNGLTTLQSINFTGNVDRIGNNSFLNCTGLTSVTFAEGSTIGKLGDYAFSGCTGLTSLILPAVGSMGSNTFQSMTNLERVTFAGHVGKIGVSAFRNDSKLSSVVFNEGVTIDSIGTTAFNGCTSLTSLTLPAVNVVGVNAFNGLTTLQSVDFTGNVGEIGNNSFQSCTSLSSVTFAESSTVGRIGSFAFILCPALTSIDLPAVTTIDARAFYSLEGLSSVTFAEGTVSIGSCAFYNCKSLASLSFPTSVTNIGIEAFMVPLDDEGNICAALETLAFEGDVKNVTIGRDAFKGTKFDYSDKTINVAVGALSTSNYDFDVALGATVHENVVNIGSTGYTTICSATDALDFTEADVKAYVCKATEDGKYISLTEVATVAKGEGAIVYCEEAANSGQTVSCTIPTADATIEKHEDNILIGVTEKTFIQDNETYIYYVLTKSKETGRIIFGRLSDAGNNVAAGKAYIAMERNSATSLANALEFSFVSDIIEGIGTVEVDASQSANDVYYTISGVRVAKPSKGIYICNGKKVIFK